MTQRNVVLYPAIDVRGGTVVRLRHGDFTKQTVYGSDPVAVARRFADDGAPWIHVVDLDAARTGEQTQYGIIASIVSAVEGRAQIQVGGGIRTENIARALADCGVACVVMGTSAVKNPELVHRIAACQPVALGIDSRDGMVATDGWLSSSTTQVVDVLQRFEGSGIAAAILTDIARDGVLSGPDYVGLSDALSKTSIPIIASGGVSSIDDIRLLAALGSVDKSLLGIIVGTALYENRFTMRDALTALRVS